MTLLTPADDAATLRRFYRLIRPGGPGFPEHPAGAQDEHQSDQQRASMHLIAEQEPVRPLRRRIRLGFGVRETFVIAKVRFHDAAASLRLKTCN